MRVSFTSNLFCIFIFSMFFGSCKDECKNMTCSSVGTCTEGVCDCNVGYQGDNCETKISDKFKGTYAGNEECDSGNSSYTSIITAINPSQFQISSFSWQNITVLATVTADEEENKNFTFSTNVSGKLFAGAGTLNENNDEIIIDYGITENNVTDSCSTVLSK